MSVKLPPLTPCRYICHLVVPGHTRASTEFCKAAQIDQPATAFLIAAIVEGYHTKDDISKIHSLHSNSFKRARDAGYIIMTDKGIRGVNHKPIMHYTLSEKVQEAWERIKPVVQKLIQRLRDKYPQS